MLVKIICPIFYLNITDGPKTIYNDLFALSKIPDEALEKYLGTEFINKIGHIDYEMMKGRYHANGYIKASDNISHGEILANIGATFRQIKEFGRTLWYIRDNCIQMGTLYAEFTMSGNKNPEYAYNSDKTFNSLSDASFDATSFTSKEILDAYGIAMKSMEKHAEENKRREVLHKEQNLNVKPKKIPRVPVPSPEQSIIKTTDNLTTIRMGVGVDEYNYRTRVERAMIFVDKARDSDFLPFKIAMYMSCLESLVSTTDTEISRTVAHRIAFLLNEVQLSVTIIDAYEVRSKLLHGDVFHNKHTDIIKLQELSSKVDDICRRAIVLIIDKHAEVFLPRKNNAIEEYFALK